MPRPPLQNAEVACGLASRDAGGRRADVAAVQTEAYAANHVLDVGLGQVRSPHSSCTHPPSRAVIERMSAARSGLVGCGWSSTISRTGGVLVAHRETRSAISA